MSNINIKELLNKNPQWKDAKGNSLLHYAVQSGDKSLVDECIKKGTDPLAYNDDNETAADIAIIWGYNEIAEAINNQIKKAMSQKIAKPLTYKSLKDIRAKSRKTKKNIFYDLASKGLFYQIVELAEKNNEIFNLEDLISKGKDGDSVIFKICQRCQLEDLIKPHLWVNNISDISNAFNSLPKVYRDTVDFNSFLSKIRQVKIKSRREQPKWKQNKK